MSAYPLWEREEDRDAQRRGGGGSPPETRFVESAPCSDPPPPSAFAKATADGPPPRGAGRICDLAIVDLQYGNIGSIALAFERLGIKARVTADSAELAAASHVVLPGVGAAGFAMRRIEALGLAEPLRALARPVLGICLGMQLLFDGSDEDGAACLGIVRGRVRRMAPAAERPVPHMGWSRLTVRDEDLGLADGDYVYFAHGYVCDDGPASVATADYGGPVPAVVRHRNFLGAQFHPERSGPAGARFLRAFVDT